MQKDEKADKKSALIGRVRIPLDHSECYFNTNGFILWLPSIRIYLINIHEPKANPILK